MYDIGKNMIPTYKKINIPHFLRVINKKINKYFFIISQSRENIDNKKYYHF